MEKLQRIGIRRCILLVILLIEMLVRFIPHWGEGYTQYVYPTLSAAVSWIASLIPLSLDEWIVIAVVTFMIVYPLRAHRKGTKGRAILLREVEVAGWMIAWFYLGWGMNYYRDPLLQRMQTKPCEVEKEVFCEFLKTYTDSLNATFSNYNNVDHEVVMSEVKSLYEGINAECGLAKPKSYQKPKMLSFNWIYSSVGVLGYMGPFAAESQLNNDLTDEQYPFVYAHELAHLLSVSNEAEANYWGYTICRQSKYSGIRFSAYLGILPNVMRNARNILTEEEYEAWTKTLSEGVRECYRKQVEFWQSKRVEWMQQAQKLMFEALLRGNKIPNGHKNYDQVLNLIISLDR